VSIAQVNPTSIADEKSLSNLSYLLQSVAALYPALEGDSASGQVTLQPEDKGERAKLSNYDLLFLNYRQLQLLKERQWEVLRQYLEVGGTLLVEAPTEGSHIKELTAVKQELQKAIANLELNSNTAEDAELQLCARS
jgi:hypothetical protein